METNKLHELFLSSSNQGVYLKDKLTEEANEKEEVVFFMVTVVDPKVFNAPDMDATDYLTKKDIMEMLHIQSDKALKLLKSTMLDSIKIGKQYLTRRCWLEEFFEKYKNQEVEL